MRYVTMVLFAAFVVWRAASKPQGLVASPGLLADVPGSTLRRGLPTGRVRLEVSATQLELATRRSSYLVLPTGSRPLRWIWLNQGYGLGLVLDGTGLLGRTVFATRTSAVELTDLLRSLGWTVSDPPVTGARIYTMISFAAVLVVVELLILDF